MFVNQLLSEARKRLTTIGTETLLTDAARALSGSQNELVVVCDPDGKAVGVIAKADVVRRITHCEGAACKAIAAAAMTQRIVSCRPDDHVSAVWSKMKQHGLRHIPIIADQSRPVGIINARDALQALLVNAVNEVELLRDYVSLIWSLSRWYCASNCAPPEAMMRLDFFAFPPTRLKPRASPSSVRRRRQRAFRPPPRSPQPILPASHLSAMPLWYGR